MKFRTFIRCVFVVLVITCIKSNNTTCTAQTVTNAGQVTWTDEFEDNHNYWWNNKIEKGNSNWKVGNGKYSFVHHDESGWQCTYVPYYIVPEKDWSLEMEVQFQEINDNSTTGIIFGRGNGNFHYLRLISDYAYEVGVYYKGEFRALVQGDLPSPIKTGKDVHLKVERKGTRMIYKVNETIVFNTYPRKFFGQNIGIWMQGDIKMVADWIQVKHPEYVVPHVNDYGEYEVVALGSEVNTNDDELSPRVSADGASLYFIRDEANWAKYEKDQDIFVAQSAGNGKWGKAVDIGPPLNDDSPNFVVGVHADNNTLYLGNVYEKDGPGGQGMSTTSRTKNGWEYPKEFKINQFKNNDDEVSYAPSTDGTILIISMEGDDTHGSDDIYVSLLQDDGTWSKPKNIGTHVNTAQDEITPFLAADNRTLYFTSDGYLGYGMYDVFVTKRIGDGWTHWTTPVNVGPTINSEYDELYFSITADGSNAYFSRFNYATNQDKPSTDIYNLKLKDAHDNHIITLNAEALAMDMDQASAMAFEVSTSEIKKTDSSIKPEPVTIVKGKVIDADTKRPLSAEIVYRDLATGKIEGTATSDPQTGEYTIVLPHGSSYGYQATADGHLSTQQNMQITEHKDNVAMVEQNLKLVPLKSGAVTNLNNVFFETGNAKILDPSHQELNYLIHLMQDHPTMKIHLVGHTSDKGSPAGLLQLSKNRAEAVKTYMVKRGIKSTRVTTEGKGMSQPRVANDSEVHRKQNRRVEFKIITM